MNRGVPRCFFLGRGWRENGWLVCLTLKFTQFLSKISHLPKSQYSRGLSPSIPLPPLGTPLVNHDSWQFWILFCLKNYLISLIFYWFSIIYWFLIKYLNIWIKNWYDFNIISLTGLMRVDVKAMSKMIRWKSEAFQMIQNAMLLKVLYLVMENVFLEGRFVQGKKIVNKLLFYK